MKTEVAWIIDALAHNRRKTKSGLAAALGIDPSAVTRLLHGERRLKFSEARLAADYLEVDPPAGFAEEGEPFDHSAEDPSYAPLLLAEADRDGFWRLDRDSVIERKPRTPQFAGVKSVFGFYAPDAAMAPRFRIGEVVWVNPVRPVAPGDDAVLVEATRTPGPDKIFLCEIISIGDDHFSVRQHGSGETKSFPKRGWAALHVFARF